MNAAAVAPAVEVLATAVREAADTVYTVPGYPITGLGEALGAEITLNEKIALEYALGDTLSGKRAVVICKHAGLHALVDPLVHAAFQGISHGILIISGDDLEVSGSQIAQDSRAIGELSRSPILNPDAAHLGVSVERVLQASETFCRPAILRVTSDLLKGDAENRTEPRSDKTGHLVPSDLTMRGRTEWAGNLTNGLKEWAKQNLAFGAVPYLGRFEPLVPPQQHPQTHTSRGYSRTFCNNCPFQETIAILQQKNMKAICDTGCALLATNPPYRVGIANYGLGSSIATAARSTRVALCGDYSVLHSGLPALIDVAEKGLPLLCIILKNTSMGMTGGQAVPDIDRYITWADPVHIQAEDTDRIRRECTTPDCLNVVIISGQCPEGEEHEKLEC